MSREREMALLEHHFEVILVCGRQRVGKTRPLIEFCKEKQCVRFFTAGETTARESLRGLSAAAQAIYDPLADPETAETLSVFATFEATFMHLFAKAQGERTILVIDEYPYLAKTYPDVSLLLQLLIDRPKVSSRLMLILCGSSMSFMEHQVLGEKSPLYGRRTGQLRVERFDYLDSSLLLDANDPCRAIGLYSLVGSVSLYLEQLDGGHTTEWNIAYRLLGQGQFLYAGAGSFLLQEVSSPAPYNAVIEALARGSPRLQEIANATGIARQT